MKLLYVSLLTVALVSGYSGNPADYRKTEVTVADSIKKPYNGKKLNIGVIGSLNREFKNVTLHKEIPVSLRDKRTPYDAFFITEEFFNELSKDKWSPVFAASNTPVFFIASEYDPFLFKMDGMDYSAFSPSATEAVSGFALDPDADDQAMQGWGYGKPGQSKEKLPDWIFYSMFRDIESYAKQ